MVSPSDFKTGGGWFWLLALVLVPGILWADEAPAVSPAPKPHFVLSAEDGRLSLVASHA